MSQQAGKIFVQEFVLAFGVLSGIYKAVGVDPIAEVIKAFISIAPELWIIDILNYLPLITLLLTFTAVLVTAGLLGIFPIFLGFIGGLMLVYNPIIGLFIIAVSAVLGFIIASQEEYIL